jgi:gliding motility-associated-like protein
MNDIKSLLIVLFICCLSGKINAQNITINDQNTPQQLVDILVNSSCAAASNSTGNGDTFRLPRQSLAYFNSNGSNFPFNEGIVLATSTAQSAIGPFVSDVNEGAGDSPQWGNDPDLDAILGINSLNTTVLEFDFIAYTSSLSFNYIFASNEYQYNYPCQYSDGFAFLIKEAGTADPYKNLAVLPNTNTPVSSINIRPKIAPGTRPGGVTYAGCEASNVSYFNGLNANNTGPVNYAGQTVVMTAQSQVIAGKKYHVKLVIGDADVRYQNSAIFLEAGSFASKIVLGEDRTLAGNNPACFGERIPLDSKLTDVDYTFKWYKKDNPTVILGTNSTFEVTEAGNYKVDATVRGTLCILSGEIKVEYAPEIPTTNTILYQCDDNTDGISIFNLTKVNNIVKNNSTENSTQGFYETLANAEAKTNPILTPEKYTNTAVNQIVFARIENRYNCFKIADVTLQISNNTIGNQNPVITCDGDDNQDGLYQFDLNSQVTPQVLSGLPNGLTVSYFLTSNDALLETNALPNLFKNTTPSSQTIYARIINGPDCYDIAPITLVVDTFDPPGFKDETQYLCNGDDITLSVATGFNSYLWSTGSTLNSIQINSSGTYTVTVTNNNGCKKTKNFQVLPSEPATITGTVVKDFSANENSVLVNYTGSGNYEFSLDGISFQDEPLFTSVNPGIYNAVARDKNGCGLSNSFQVIVLDYPRFFTPNGDGYNDLWLIKNLDQLPECTIFIFDRYGKLLKQMNQNNNGWTGVFNGQQLPSDDYWFNLIFSDGKTIKGHFSLKR